MTLLPVVTSPSRYALTQTMAAADRAALRRAIKDLEHRSLATRLSVILGRQLTLAGRMLPAQFAEIIEHAAESAIRLALKTALRSLKGRRAAGDRRLWHKTAATLSGAAGGAFGLTSLPIELPISTVVMLRSIAAIARTEGENLAAPTAALACLQVFALGAGGGIAQQHDGDPQAVLEGGYFATRALLAQSVSEAAHFILERGVADETAPALVRLATQVATRFGLVVSEKVAAQALPLIGAAGGAAVNYAFIDHFQTLARGHFTVRRLERVYGPALVRAEYRAALHETARVLG